MAIVGLEALLTHSLSPLIGILYKSCCSLLDGFNLIDGVLMMGIPNSGAVFKMWSDQRDVSLFFQTGVAMLQVPLYQPQHPVGFQCDGGYVCLP